MDAIEFMPLSWIGKDVDDAYRVDIFGRTQDGRSVCAHVDFYPYFFAEAPPGTMPKSVEQVKYEIAGTLKRMWRSEDEDADPESQIASVSVVRRKKFFGFTNERYGPFYLVVMRTLDAARLTSRVMAKKGYVLYESNVDPILRLIHVRDLESAGWVRAEKRQQQVPRATACDVEFRLGSYKDLSRVDREGIAPLVIASFDIEVYSADGSFPRAQDEGCPVIQVATAFQRVGEREPYRRVVHCLGETEAEPDGEYETFCHAREDEMLVAWARDLRKEQADALMGYNIWGFDMDYVWGRITHDGMSSAEAREDFRRLAGKYADGSKSQQIKMRLSSSAYGNNEFFTFSTPGILQIDLLPVFRKDFKLESYKLDSVAETFLGERKVDMPIQRMFELYRGSAADRREIAKYCAQDALLPLRLAQKLAVVPNMIEMAKATHIPIDWLDVRGQQIRAFSQILKLARLNEYVVPTEAPGEKNTEGYEGATVLDPETGPCWDPVVTLDFSSLYPSIIRAHNLCHSTLVADPAFDNLPGVEYYECDGARFAQNPKGILPKLLEGLAAFRKKAKKQMEEAAERGDAFMEMIFDAKQKAMKVCANSVYGILGSAHGYVPCLPIAATVTTTGRRMIEHSKNLVERRYPGARVRYGDSVAGYMPVLVRYRGRPACWTIENVARRAGGDAWEAVAGGGGGKESCELRELDAWTERGWTRVYRVIRHALSREKRMVRVATADGSAVDVTDDHSLLLEDGTPASPRQVRVGETRLLQRACPELRPFPARITNLPPNLVIKADELVWKEQFVYDLTTDNHHFQAGIGSIVVHNTDSIFIDFGVKGLAEAFRLGKEAAAEVTKTFRSPISLEFEKVYWPYVLYSKKRYVGVKFTDPQKPGKLDIKGLQIVRRDSCALVKRVSRQALDKIMFDRDTDAAVDVCRRAVRDLFEGRVDSEELVLSKTLKASAEALLMDLHKVCDKCNAAMRDAGEAVLECGSCGRKRTCAYKNLGAQPHALVAIKQERRTPGSGPSSNERVRFLYVEGPKAINASEKAEDPEFVKEKGLNIDYMYIYTNQLTSPLEQLFEAILPAGRELFDEAYVREYVRQNQARWKQIDRDYNNKQKQQRPITAFFPKLK